VTRNMVFLAKLTAGSSSEPRGTVLARNMFE
jgi:hypothetical protein